jgi:hypothetical protein
MATLPYALLTGANVLPHANRKQLNGSHFHRGALPQGQHAKKQAAPQTANPRSHCCVNDAIGV